MSTDRLLKRCASARFIDIGVLSNYRLTFPIRDLYWGAGVAGVEPSPGDTVEGVIFDLTRGDLRLLDGYEEVDLGDYFRKRFRIKLKRGSDMFCEVYLSRGHGHYAPHREYLEYIIGGAFEHGLSASYLTFLRSISIAPSRTRNLT